MGFMDTVRLNNEVMTANYKNMPYRNGYVVRIKQSEPDGYGGYIYDVIWNEWSGTKRYDVNVPTNVLESIFDGWEG